MVEKELTPQKQKCPSPVLGSASTPKNLELRGSGSFRSWRTSSLSKAQRDRYYRVDISADDGGLEMGLACEKIVKALDTRDWYQQVISGITKGTLEAVKPGTPFKMVNGVCHFEGQQDFGLPGYSTYIKDVKTMFETIEHGPTKSTCRNRLKILDEKYAIYISLNYELEENTCPIRKGGGVFSNCVKVDNSVRLSTAMHPQDLLDYIVHTYETVPETVVGKTPEGKDMKLIDVFKKYQLTDPRMLTVEGVGLHPPVQKRFHRFDIFSKDYNRGGEKSAELLKLYLKREGPFYHNLVRPILDRNEKEFPEQRVATEYKLPIFGNSRDEWTKLAQWVGKNKLLGHQSNSWIIQIPRIAALRFMSSCRTTQEQLDNIFLPLWEASLDANHSDNTLLSQLLVETGAFNIISDEQVRGQDLVETANRPPEQWPWSENPPDLFFNYYVFANISSLNNLRARNGLNTFAFRPHCGESGKLDQLVGGYMLAANINHGYLMERSQVLQYLFYLSQVGIVLSPLQSNGMSSPVYANNPFPKFHKRGMRVSLGTDDPLHYHHSHRPCIEEYGTAAKLYKLGPVDITEIARNSVLNSGFSDSSKRQWLGEDYLEVDGNDSTRSFVPQVRLQFREDTLYHEQKVLSQALQNKGSNQGLNLTKRKATGDKQPNVALSGEHEKDIEFPRITISTPGIGITKDAGEAALKVSKCMALRKKYIQSREVEGWLDLGVNVGDTDANEFKAHDGAWEYLPKGGVYRYKQREDNGDNFLPTDIHDLQTFFNDYNTIHDYVEDMHVKSLSHKRLQVLEHKFQLHMALNALLENATEDGMEQSRDFYQTPKVDTHIHAAAGMTARQLLEFIVEKAEHCQDDVVQLNGDKDPVTLAQLLRKMRITADALTVHHLNVQADASLFERFDNFNDKYNPMGNADLRTLLLKTDNYMGGRYFAEIAKKTFAQYSQDKYTYAEMRLSIYGRKRNEWTNLAQWFDTHGMASNHNKWMVQVPRIYKIFRKHGSITSFQELISNVFEPLWAVSVNPASDPKLHHFLKHMSGFDSVDNESTLDSSFPLQAPTEWTSHDNPPYGYWMYYMWANIKSLNSFRSKMGLSTFSFRPHCGESGSVDHLMFCYLTADQVNHGVNLRHDPCLEYLYYLSQVGIAVSPLSNNSLFLDYLQNPFPTFFRRGLYVSLSTDDPLQFHHTQEPLIEEYSIASKVWKLNANDMCEIARNSVVQSGFDTKLKADLLGDKYLLSSSAGNDAQKSHLSHVRCTYRFEAYHAEIDALEAEYGKPIFEKLRSMYTMNEERQLLKKANAHRNSMAGVIDGFNIDGNSSDTSPNTLARSYSLMEEMVKENEELRNHNSSLKEALKKVSENLQVTGLFDSPLQNSPHPPDRCNTTDPTKPVPMYVGEPRNITTAPARRHLDEATAWGRTPAPPPPPSTIKSVLPRLPVPSNATRKIPLSRMLTLEQNSQPQNSWGSSPPQQVINTRKQQNGTATTNGNGNGTGNGNGYHGATNGDAVGEINSPPIQQMAPRRYK